MLKFSPLALATAVSLVISTASSVRAVVINGSFETGSFNDGWTTTGATTIETSQFGSSPTNGVYQAFLETLADPNSTGVSGSNLESFLGLTSESLSNLGVIEGSAIKQTLTALAGDVLTFSGNFLTDQPPNSEANDFAFFALNRLTQVADTNSSTLSDSFFTSFARETGYQTYTYRILTAGTYTLGFRVVDVGDSNVRSGLLVDNVSVDSSATPVPFEFSPGLGLLVLGAWGVSGQIKRRLSKNRVRAELIKH